MSVIQAATSMNVVYVGKFFQNLTPAYLTINDAIRYVLNRMDADAAGPFNTYTIRVCDGLYQECVNLPDYTALVCEGRVIIGGDDNTSNQVVLNIGQGCTVVNACITPYTQSKDVGLLIRDPTTVWSANYAPFDLDGLELVLNGVSDSTSDDITITFVGNGLSASDVCTQINDVSVTAGHAYAYNIGDVVYIQQLTNSPPSSMLIVRASGTANEVLGFSVEEDTTKSRQPNSTILFQGCSIIGDSLYSVVNNGNSWNECAVAMHDNGMFNTLLDRVVIDGGSSGNEVSGIKFVAGAPVLFGCSVSSFYKNNSYAFEFNNDLFTVIPTMINAASYLNSYDFKLDCENNKQIILLSTFLDVNNIHPDSTASLSLEVNNKTLGIAYGGICNFNSNVTSTIGIVNPGLANMVGVVGSFTADMPYNFGVIPHFSSNYIEISKTGIYTLEMGITISHDATTDAIIGVGIFDTAGSDNYGFVEKTVAVGTKENLTISNIVEFSASKDLQLFIWSSVAPITVTVYECYLKAQENK